MRAFLFAPIVAAGCAGSPRPEVRAPAPAVGDTAPAFPRAGACVPFVEPGMSHPSPDIECVPPRHLSPGESARHFALRGEHLRAADCAVAAYEGSPGEAAFALQAGRLYRLAGRRDLARVYYRRFLDAAPGDARSDGARRDLSALDASDATGR